MTLSILPFCTDMAGPLTTRLVYIMLAFHDADTDTDLPNMATSLRPMHAISSRGLARTQRVSDVRLQPYLASWCRCPCRGMPALLTYIMILLEHLNCNIMHQMNIEITYMYYLISNQLLVNQDLTANFKIFQGRHIWSCWHLFIS